MRCGQQTELLDPSSFYIMNYSASYMLTLWIIFHVSPVHKTTLPPTSTAIWIFYCRAVGVTHLAIRAIEKKPFKQNHNKQKCRMACNLEQNAALSLQNYSKNRPRIPRWTSNVEDSLTVAHRSCWLQTGSIRKRSLDHEDNVTEETTVGDSDHSSVSEASTAPTSWKQWKTVRKYDAGLHRLLLLEHWIHFLSTLQEEHACLITPPVNKCNLLSDFCSQVCVVRLYSLITSALPALRSFSSGSACYELSCEAKQRLILDIDAPVFVLLSSFCPDAEVFGTEGNQTLSTSITLPFPSAYYPFSRIMQAQFLLRSKGELVFILRFAFAGRVSSQRVQAWMFWVKSWTAWMWVLN